MHTLDWHSFKLKKLHSFPRFLWHRFWDDQCFEAAGALAYTTMLAIVPLGAVSLSIISAFPQFQLVKEQLLEFLFTQFVPSAGSAIKQYIEPLFDRASALTVPGVIALMVSAVLMMNSIESTFNRIWRAPTARPPLSRFVVFWTALTLGPLLLAASLAITGYARSLPFLQHAAAQADELGATTTLLALAPVLIEFVAFTLSYIIVPHRDVRWRHACAGGLLATLLFELAKRAFVWYIAAFPATKQIYDALSLLPIFILWLYILWLIVLLGASFASSLAAYRFERDQPPVAPDEWLPLALRVLGQLKQAQLRGDGMSNADLKERIAHLTDDLLQRFFADFDALKLVSRTELGRWILARDLSSVTLLELYRTGHYPLPTRTPEPALGESWELILRKQLTRLAEQNHLALMQPLAGFFANSKAESRPVLADKPDDAGAVS
jgi:membrane protein